MPWEDTIMILLDATAIAERGNGLTELDLWDLDPNNMCCLSHTAFWLELKHRSSHAFQLGAGLQTLHSCSASFPQVCHHCRHTAAGLLTARSKFC